MKSIYNLIQAGSISRIGLIRQNDIVAGTVAAMLPLNVMDMPKEGSLVLVLHSSKAKMIVTLSTNVPVRMMKPPIIHVMMPGRATEAPFLITKRHKGIIAVGLVVVLVVLRVMEEGFFLQQGLIG